MLEALIEDPFVFIVQNEFVEIKPSGFRSKDPL